MKLRPQKLYSTDDKTLRYAQISATTIRWFITNIGGSVHSMALQVHSTSVWESLSAV